MGKRPTTSDVQALNDALLTRVQKQAWFHRYPRGWPFLLFVIILAGTIASVVAIERADRQARAAELDRNATEIASGLERRALENVAQLRAVAALVASRPRITSQEFDDFVQSAYQREDDGSVVSTGWAPLISAAQIPALEAEQRAAGHPDFAVWPRPASATSIAAPGIDVAPPSTVKRPVLGFDMLSQPERRIAIGQAMRLGRATATARLSLIPSGRDQGRVGFVIYMPVRRVNGGGHSIVGLVYSPFSADDFLGAAAQVYRGRNVELAIYDGTAERANLLAMRSVPGEIGSSIDRKLEIAGREWTLRVSSKRTQMLTALSEVTLIFGVLAGLLVMFTARVITRRAVEDRNLLEWVTRQSTIRTQLTRELNHRVKNTLANVLSIVALTRRRSSDIGEFAESLTARLRALSATHDILSQSDWTEAGIGEIVRSELAPYIQAGEGQIHMDGPAVSLAPNDALSLGLAIHELATNAAKYGALSTPGGRIAVDWRLLASDLAEVQWRESGGPRVEPPTRRGFGLDLIEKVVSHEMRSRVVLDFAPEGVMCVLEVPVRRPTEFSLRQQPQVAPA
jgi:two-component sensor histidine kinase